MQNYQTMNLRLRLENLARKKVITQPHGESTESLYLQTINPIEKD